MREQYSGSGGRFEALSQMTTTWIFLLCSFAWMRLLLGSYGALIDCGLWKLFRAAASTSVSEASVFITTHWICLWSGVDGFAVWKREEHGAHIMWWTTFWSSLDINLNIYDRRRYRLSPPRKGTRNEYIHRNHQWMHPDSCASSASTHLLDGTEAGTSHIKMHPHATSSIFYEHKHQQYKWIVYACYCGDLVATGKVKECAASDA